MVARLSLFEVWMPLREGFETSFGRTTLRPTILVRIEDEGYEGWGEVVAGEGPWYSCETYATAWHVIRDFLAKRIPPSLEPAEFQKAVAKVRGHNMAKAGVEMALWDLKARKKGVPLYKMIGGEKRPVKVGVSIGIQETVEDLLKVVSHYLDRGYARIKLKIKPGWDVGIVERVRREYPDILLQVDANAAYTLSDLQVLQALDKYDLLMIEQPLHYADLLDHARLSRRLRTPLCLDESIPTPQHARWALQLGSADIVNLKPGRVGGILPSLEIHRLWYEAAGRPLWIGGMLETGVGRGFLVALGTLPGVKYPSDISASDRYYEEDIVDEPWRLEPGSVLTPRDRPGIGVNVDMDKLSKYVRRTEHIRI